MQGPTRRKPKPRGNWRVCGTCDGYGLNEDIGSERCEFGPSYHACRSCGGKGWRRPQRKNAKV